MRFACDQNGTSWEVNPIGTRFRGTEEMLTVAQIVANPSVLSLMSNEEIYTMSSADARELQQQLIEKRFREVRPRIGVVRRLAEDLHIDRLDLDKPADIASLCLPHTFYKSYSAADVEKGRFDRLTRWLASLTALDISNVDVSGCDSLETWLDAIEAQTQIRPICSSGTNGKISFFPRSTTEDQYFIRNFVLFNSGFRGELDSGLAKADIDMLSPWPLSTGNHGITTIFRLLRENVFSKSSREHIYTLGKGHWNLDMMWLTSRLRAAEAKGDTASVSALGTQLSRIQAGVLASETETARNIDAFMNEIIINQRNRKVFLFAPPKEFYALTLECERRGVKPQFAPDSYIFVPGRGNSKGGTLPDGWWDQCKAIFPFEYQGVYAMTECTGAARLCPADHFHLPPWVYLSLLDPETSQPLPRTGVQTGRLALFDTLPENFWGGTISGDRVTVNWSGGCSCGRIGAYIHNDIVRYGNLKDDDKITCSKTTDAYEKAIDYVLGHTLD
jgi:hypothetical protein